MKSGYISGNTLKIIAAVAMVIDHVGLMFFPYSDVFRIIGRLAFPIFAFMISEGARYTKSRLRYFLSMFTLGVICQIVYFFFDGGSLYMCILITFSLGVLPVFALGYLKKCIFNQGYGRSERLIAAGLFISSIILVIALNEVLTIDYGAAGCFAPLFASLFDFRGIDVPEYVKRLDTLPIRTLTFGLALIILALSSGSSIQFFSLLALPFLLCYSGKRGKYRMKYFFYIFYPLHLVLLEGIYLAIYFLK